MRRAAARLAAAAVVTLAFAGPAGAHEQGWEGSGWRTQQDTRFTQPPTVSFTFQHQGSPGIERVSLTVAAAGNTELAEPCRPPVIPDIEDGPNPLEVTDLPVTIPCNGRYQLSAVAFGERPLLAPEQSPTLTLTFDVAVPPPPPTDVAAEVTDLDGDTAARVTWKPPEFVPPDFLGYQISRSRSADGEFVVVGESVEPTFVDGEAAEGGTFFYVVHSVRLGAEPTPSESASVDVPVPSTPTSAGTTSPTTGARDLSGFGTLQQQAARLRPGAPPPPAAVIRPGPVTTIDDGFQQTLPFDPNAPGSPSSTAAAELDSGLAAGGSSQIFEDDSPSDRKALLGPVAGALALLVVFLQLRWLLRQAQPG